MTANIKLTVTPLLTIDDLVNWLRVKKSTIRKKVCYNRIPYIRIGRSIRFKREEIEAWLAKNNRAL